MLFLFLYCCCEYNMWTVRSTENKKKSCRWAHQNQKREKKQIGITAHHFIQIVCVSHHTNLQTLISRSRWKCSFFYFFKREEKNIFWLTVRLDFTLLWLCLWIQMAKHQQQQQKLIGSKKNEKKVYLNTNQMKSKFQWTKKRRNSKFIEIWLMLTKCQISHSETAWPSDKLWFFSLLFLNYTDTCHKKEHIVLSIFHWIKENIREAYFKKKSKREKYY